MNRFELGLLMFIENDLSWNDYFVFDVDDFYLFDPIDIRGLWTEEAERIKGIFE